jgi:threonine/homoserine/homoserine lactone efflux protein
MLNITPGPDMLYCASRAIGQGRIAGVFSALGSGTGGLIHTAVAAAGLSAIFVYSEIAYEVLKYAGTVYLVYLGIRLILNRRQGLTPISSAVSTIPRIYLQGMLTTVLNPKVALFFLAFLPQFIDPSRGSVSLQTLTLGTIFCFNGTIVLLVVGLLFGQIGKYLDSRPRFWKIQRWTTGSILITLGASLAFSKR